MLPLRAMNRCMRGRRDGGAALVRLTGVEHDHRVAAELEHVAAVLEHDVDQAAEHGVEHVVDVLGTGPAESWRVAR